MTSSEDVLPLLEINCGIQSEGWDIVRILLWSTKAIAKQIWVY